ncbi:MAG TPA: type II toxin-antitoxin system RelE/ParE family toxin [Solimonas sp.]|nr:type II toxin-antitoxin system RelE/ParE family toxin [Solimonas sp.]
MLHPRLPSPAGASSAAAVGGPNTSCPRRGCRGEVALHLSFASDLMRLRAFIAEDKPLAARPKIAALRRSIRQLLEQPKLGREIDEASGMPVGGRRLRRAVFHR